MFKFAAIVATASAITLNGNSTRNATTNATRYGTTDFGVAEGEIQHGETIGKWSEREDIRVAGIKAQQRANDAKNKLAQTEGPVCSWVSHLNTTTDYGVGGGVHQHGETMNWNDMKEKERAAAVKAQQDSDVWRKSNPGPYPDFPNCAAQKK